MLIISDEDIDRYIREDVPYGDLTSRSLGLVSGMARIDLRAGAPLVACCTEEAARILARLGCAVTPIAASGATLDAGAAMVSATGPAEAVLAGWKVAQTLMEYASGIATAAARMVAAARSVREDAVIACTRKTFPGTKTVATKAILAGGAVPHRLGLSDTVLVFPEHLTLLGNTPLVEAIARLKRSCPEKKVVIEVNTIEEAEEAAAAAADVIQLEKFTPASVAEVVRRLPTAILAVAGGVNAGNAADYARAGAGILVTSAPYAAPPVDVKVSIAPAG